MVLPDAIDDYPGGQRIISRDEPFRQRQSPSRRPPVGGRKLGGRIALCDDADESGLGWVCLAIRIAAQQKIRRRDLIIPFSRAQLQEFPGSHVFKFTFRTRAVVAVSVSQFRATPIAVSS